ncbi:MAG TPA: 4-hydroxy-tetrahydrodipicolinate synthase [Dehalococcoidia bacterium]|nr:4-hydroxy-tetrahydrodipicolinate synthase [Dehalococcoidia bacterium]
MAEIGRLLTAMVTPFDDRGEVDYAQARRLAQALLDSGSDGVVVSGTTGEAPTLTHEEKLRLFTEVKQAVDGRGVVIAGTGTYSTAESIELSKEAAQRGVDGLLLTVPYYNRPTQEGLFRHFEAIARSTSLPCIMYNIPGRTGTNMTAETTLRLSRVPNIVGVKEASGNLDQIARIVDGAGEGFRVWSGNDGDTLLILAVGGYGVICVLSHLTGLQMKQLIESYLAGRVGEAAKIHRRLLALNNALMTLASNPIPIKYALNQIGFRAGAPRLPLLEPDEATGEKIMAEVRRHHIDLPVAV